MTDNKQEVLDCRRPYLSKGHDNTYCIPLTQNQVALIDAEDLAKVSGKMWCYDKGYAVNRTLKTSMHQLIMNTPKGMHTDHVDGNGLDNRKCNLRICTAAQNQWNSKKYKSKPAGYKGVSLHKDGKYQASIRIEGKLKHLGLYETPREAALVYDNYAKQYRGQYARTNF